MDSNHQRFPVPVDLSALVRLPVLPSHQAGRLSALSAAGLLCLNFPTVNAVYDCVSVRPVSFWLNIARADRSPLRPGIHSNCRRLDSNQRSSAYEADEMANFSTPVNAVSPAVPPFVGPVGSGSQELILTISDDPASGASCPHYKSIRTSSIRTIWITTPTRNAATIASTK